MSDPAPHLRNKEVRPLFVTPLMRRDYADVEAMNRGLADLVLELERNQPNNAGKTTNLGGFHTGPQFLDRNDPPVVQLRQLIVEAVSDYSKDFIRTNCTPNLPPLSVRIWGWAIVMRAGDSNFQHIHADAKISGVYYVRIPNDGAPPPVGNPEGALIFLDPRPRAQMNRMPNQMTELVFDPAAGSMVVFPSYFEHGVVPFRGPGLRICVAFNAQVEERPRTGPRIG